MKLTRRSLYDLIWTEPLTKVAADFGLSDVGLAKICERHRVPTPPRSYWARIAAGQRVKKTHFTEADDPAVENIDVGVSLDELPTEVREVVKRHKAEREIRRTEKAKVFEAPTPPTVKEIAELSPAIRRTARTLRSRSSQSDGVARAFGEGECGVEVGAASVERAIAILDALAVELAARGIPLQPRGKKMHVAQDCDEADFVIGELTRWLPYEPTEADLEAEARRLRQRERYSRGQVAWSEGLYRQAYPEKFLHRTGELFIQIDGYSDGVRRKWADGKRQSLETLIRSIADGFEVLLAARKVRRLESEERERRWAEQQRRRRMAEGRVQREKDRAAFTEQLINRHAEIRRLETWLHEAEANGASMSDTAYLRMMEWVRASLEDLQRSVSPDGIEYQLNEKKLFPAPGADELFDPLGEPPSQFSYW